MGKELKKEKKKTSRGRSLVRLSQRREAGAGQALNRAQGGQRGGKKSFGHLANLRADLAPLRGKSMLSASREQQFGREVCGNKVLMCFLFVAARSYQDAWYKLFGLPRNIATFHPASAI